MESERISGILDKILININLGDITINLAVSPFFVFMFVILGYLIYNMIANMIQGDFI